MGANVAFNPMLTTNAAGSFATQFDGFIQGTAMDDPSARFRLAGGILADTETVPMWGGVGISEGVTPTPSGPSGELGGLITRATVIAQGVGQLTGFSVFDQNYSAINTPQSPVPLVGSKGMVNFYRFGSNARVTVAIDPSLASLEGGIITAPVSWDFSAQKLIPFSAAYSQAAITGAVWAATGGGEIDYTVSTDLTSEINAGDDIDVSGIISTGGTGAGLNGNYTVLSISSTHIVVSAPAAASPGTYSSGGHVNAGGGAVPCKVLGVNIGNSMTVSFDPATGFATWNRSGSAALIQI